MLNPKRIVAQKTEIKTTRREKLYLALFGGIPLLLLGVFMVKTTLSTQSYISRGRSAVMAGRTAHGFELLMTAVNRGSVQAVSTVVASRQLWSPEQYNRFLTLAKTKAEGGDQLFQNVMGELYTNGYGVRQDYAAALGWFKKSAEQGNAEAQYNIGIFYFNGYGVFADPAQALVWFQKSADGGNLIAARMVLNVKRLLRSSAAAGGKPASGSKSKK